MQYTLREIDAARTAVGEARRQERRYRERGEEPPQALQAVTVQARLRLNALRATLEAQRAAWRVVWPGAAELRARAG